MKDGIRPYRWIMATVLAVMASHAGAISRGEFFDRLEVALGRIETFQSKVWQESRYPDGVVQQYWGELAVSPDGRIAYHYDLSDEKRDPNLIPKTGVASGAPQVERSESKSGVYLTQGDRVNQYIPEQNLFVESPDDGNLLVQLFQALVGAGDFDLEKFKEEHKVLRIVEETLQEDGTPVFVMVAQPRKDSTLYRTWASKTNKDISSFQQELWVRQSDFQPVFARLHSTEESTSVRLIDTRINQSLEGNPFVVQAAPGARKIQQGVSTPADETIDTRPAVEKPLESIPLEK
jgi:outer membrane lipoprotein-sorting protein